MNFQQGAYGDPTNMETLVVFWTRMELLHYPGASDTRTYMEGKLAEQRAMEEQQAAMMGMIPPGAGVAAPSVSGLAAAAFPASGEGYAEGTSGGGHAATAPLAAPAGGGDGL